MANRRIDDNVKEQALSRLSKLGREPTNVDFKNAADEAGVSSDTVARWHEKAGTGTTGVVQAVVLETQQKTKSKHAEPEPAVEDLKTVTVKNTANPNNERLKGVLRRLVPGPGMRYYAVHVVGQEPGLLMHRLDLADLSNNGKKKGDLTPQEAAAKSRYLSADGKELVIPAVHLRGSMMNASGRVNVQVNGKKVGARRLVAGGVHIYPDMVPLGKKENEYQVDSRVARNENTGGRIIASRAHIPVWDVWFVVASREDVLGRNPEVLRTLLVEAGFMYGIGSYRPENGGPFGQFVVDYFEEANLGK